MSPPVGSRFPAPVHLTATETQCAVTFLWWAGFGFHTDAARRMPVCPPPLARFLSHSKAYPRKPASGRSPLAF